MLRAFAAILLALACGTPGSMQDPVVVEFEGVVIDDGITRDDFGLLPPVAPGDHFTGHYAYYRIRPLVNRRPGGHAYLYWFRDFPSAGLWIEINGDKYSFTNETPAANWFAISTEHRRVQPGEFISEYRAAYHEGTGDDLRRRQRNKVSIEFVWNPKDVPSDPLRLPNLSSPMLKNHFSLTLRGERLSKPPWLAASRVSGKLVSIRIRD